MSKKLEKEIVEAIKKVYDPEIPVNIYELGLIYKIDIQKDGHVEITMTLTFQETELLTKERVNEGY